MLEINFILSYLILSKISMMYGMQVEIVNLMCTWSAEAQHVECRTCNQVSPGSNPPLLPFQRLGIFVLPIDTPVDSAV